MIAPEDDDGLVAQIEPVERVEYAPNLLVHETDRGVVSADHLAGFACGSVAPYEEIGVTSGNGDFGKSGWRRRARCEIGRQSNLRRVVKFEEFFRRGGRAVRLGEPDCQEKRAVFVSLQILNRASRRPVI